MDSHLSNDYRLSIRYHRNGQQDEYRLEVSGFNFKKINVYVFSIFSLASVINLVRTNNFQNNGNVLWEYESKQN